jgi:hypothetical protein
MPQSEPRRKIKHLMSKSINVQNGYKSLDAITYTESPLEADFVYHLEFDTDVVSYMAQPSKLPYFFDGSARKYTADFEVYYSDGTIRYFEVKYLCDIENIVDFDAWQAAISKAAVKKGRSFEVITEEMIRQEFYYENLQTLYAARTIDIDSEFLLHVLKTFSDKNEVTINQLITDQSSDLEFEQVYRLIFDKVLQADLENSFLSKQSIVRNLGSGYDKYL